MKRKAVEARRTTATAGAGDGDGPAVAVGCRVTRASPYSDVG